MIGTFPEHGTHTHTLYVRKKALRKTLLQMDTRAPPFSLFGELCVRQATDFVIINFKFFSKFNDFGSELNNKIFNKGFLIRKFNNRSDVRRSVRSAKSLYTGAPEETLQRSIHTAPAPLPESFIIRLFSPTIEVSP